VSECLLPRLEPQHTHVVHQGVVFHLGVKEKCQPVADPRHPEEGVGENLAGERRNRHRHVFDRKPVHGKAESLQQELTVRLGELHGLRLQF